MTDREILLTLLAIEGIRIAWSLVRAAWRAWDRMEGGVR